MVVPPVPDKNAFGRFQDTFVQQRRQALEKCIQKAANHPVLCKDPDLRLFLESDTFALDVSRIVAMTRLELTPNRLSTEKLNLPTKEVGYLLLLVKQLRGRASTKRTR